MRCPAWPRLPSFKKRTVVRLGTPAAFNVPSLKMPSPPAKLLSPVSVIRLPVRWKPPSPLMRLLMVLPPPPITRLPLPPVVTMSRARPKPSLSTSRPPPSKRSTGLALPR